MSAFGQHPRATEPPPPAAAPGMVQHDLGNNEAVSTGMSWQPGEGRWLCLTRSESAWLKTERGAAAWLARRGYKPDGTRLE